MQVYHPNLEFLQSTQNWHLLVNPRTMGCSIVHYFAQRWMLLKKQFLHILKVFVMFPNPLMTPAFLHAIPILFDLKKAIFIIHRGYPLPSTVCIDQDKRLEMDAKAVRVAVGFSVTIKVKFTSNQQDKITSVPRGGVSENKPYSGGVSEQRSQSPRTRRSWELHRRQAGLPLISSSFIPSPHIITLSGRGYILLASEVYISFSQRLGPDRLADFHKTDEETSPPPGWSRIKCSAGLQITCYLWRWTSEHDTRPLSSCITMH